MSLSVNREVVSTYSAGQESIHCQTEDCVVGANAVFLSPDTPLPVKYRQSQYGSYGLFASNSGHETIASEGDRVQRHINTKSPSEILWLAEFECRYEYLPKTTEEVDFLLSDQIRYLLQRTSTRRLYQLLNHYFNYSFTLEFITKLRDIIKISEIEAIATKEFETCSTRNLSSDLSSNQNTCDYSTYLTMYVEDAIHDLTKSIESIDNIILQELSETVDRPIEIDSLLYYIRTLNKQANKNLWRANLILFHNLLDIPKDQDLPDFLKDKSSYIEHLEAPTKDDIKLSKKDSILIWFSKFATKQEPEFKLVNEDFMSDNTRSQRLSAEDLALLKGLNIAIAAGDNHSILNSLKTILSAISTPCDIIQPETFDAIPKFVYDDNAKRFITWLKTNMGYNLGINDLGAFIETLPILLRASGGTTFRLNADDATRIRNFCERYDIKLSIRLLPYLLWNDELEKLYLFFRSHYKAEALSEKNLALYYSYLTSNLSPFIQTPDFSDIVVKTLENRRLARGTSYVHYSITDIFSAIDEIREYEKQVHGSLLLLHRLGEIGVALPERSPSNEATIIASLRRFLGDIDGFNQFEQIAIKIGFKHGKVTIKDMEDFENISPTLRANMSGEPFYKLVRVLSAHFDIETSFSNVLTIATEISIPGSTMGNNYELFFDASFQEFYRQNRILFSPFRERAQLTINDLSNLIKFYKLFLSDPAILILAYKWHSLTNNRLNTSFFNHLDTGDISIIAYENVPILLASLKKLKFELSKNDDPIRIIKLLIPFTSTLTNDNFALFLEFISRKYKCVNSHEDIALAAQVYDDPKLRSFLTSKSAYTVITQEMPLGHKFDLRKIKDIYEKYVLSESH